MSAAKDGLYEEAVVISGDSDLVEPIRDANRRYGPCTSRTHATCIAISLLRQPRTAGSTRRSCPDANSQTPCTCLRVGRSGARRRGGRRSLLSGGLKARHDKPPLGASAIDELLRGETRPGAEVGQVPFRSARPNADSGRCIWHRAPGGDECGEDVDLTGSARRRWLASQSPVPHARSPAAASHSSRPSMGML